MKYIIDNFSDDELMKIIRKFINHIYGKQLTMKENSSGYLSFYSSGPVPPYHRNLSGRLWCDDDRLYNIIENFFSTDWQQTFALIGFYFSNFYGIKVTDTRFQPHIFPNARIDYSQFDDPSYKDDEDVITESQFDRYKKLVREYVKSMKYPGVCKIELMEDKEDKMYVHIFFSAEWYAETANTGGEMSIVKKVVGTLVDIKEELEDTFSPMKFYMRHSIRANKDC
jgi:hypothetical protein